MVVDRSNLTSFVIFLYYLQRVFQAKSDFKGFCFICLRWFCFSFTLYHFCISMLWCIYIICISWLIYLLYDFYFFKFSLVYCSIIKHINDITQCIIIKYINNNILLNYINILVRWIIIKYINQVHKCIISTTSKISSVFNQLS